jgi:cysteinyl-tRNA synthetase
VVLILAIAGVVAGILLASAALEDTLKVSVTDTEVQFQKNKRTRRVPREQIRVAFLDGNDIVLQAADSRELARERHDQLKSEAKRISAAFEAHGYPWSAEGDPYRNAFRRWVEDHPEVPPAVNAVLRARSKAIALGDKGKADARELRDEVAKLGYVIRDENANQYWRSIAQPD